MFAWTDSEVYAFMQESNRIEGIEETTGEQVCALIDLLWLDDPTLGDLRRFVSVCQPNAMLRDKSSLNVLVGSHVAPKGGPEIPEKLVNLLGRIRTNAAHPYLLHHEYETLHPFTDGNGRSGRALWAWQMTQHRYRPGLQLGFLHAWYYQSLQHSSSRLKETQ